MVHKVHSLSREVVFYQGEKTTMKQTLVPRYTGLSREVVSGQGAWPLKIATFL